MLLFYLTLLIVTAMGILILSKNKLNLTVSNKSNIPFQYIRCEKCVTNGTGSREANIIVNYYGKSIVVELFGWDDDYDSNWAYDNPNKWKKIDFIHASKMIIDGIDSMMEISRQRWAEAAAQGEEIEGLRKELQELKEKKDE